MPERNGVGTIRVQVSLDEVSTRILDRMVPAGIFGKNRGEVASWIMREWIWHNPTELQSLGICVKDEMNFSVQRDSDSLL